MIIPQGQLILSPTTVPINTSISATVSTGGMALCGIQLPAALTSTALTFLASQDGVLFQPLYNSAGQVSYTVAAARFIAIDPKDFQGVPYFQIKTGSTEVAARALTLSLKGI